MRAAVPAALLLAALAYFWRFGYSFGAGDHDELLPPVLAFLDPALYPVDWYVQLQASSFNVRSPFTVLVAALAAILGLEGAVALLWAGSLTAVLVGLYWLARELGARPATAVAGVFTAAVLTSTWTLGGNSILYSMLAPELMAWALIVPGMVLMLRRRLLVAATLIGVAAWLQVLAAALAAASLGLAMLVVSWRRQDLRLARRTVTRFGLPCMAIAAPFVALVGLAPLEATAPATAVASSFHVIAELRGPHHYLPLAFGFDRYVRFFAVAIPGVLAWWWLHRRGAVVHGAVLGAWLGVAAVMLAAAFAFVEGFGSLLVAKLQVFKLTVLIQAVLSILLVMGVSRLLPTSVMARADAVLLRRGLPYPVAAAALLLTSVFVVTDIGRPAALFQPLQHRQADLHQIERWAREATPREALFVVPPSNTTFRLHARRSVLITFKPTPFQDELMHHWLDRLLQVAPMEVPVSGDGFLERLDQAYHAAGPEHWERLARHFGADYVMVDLERLTGAPPAPPVHTAGRWAVFSLSDHRAAQ